MELSKRYLPCTIGAGMFPNEYSVQIELDEQTRFSLFSDCGNVKNGNGNKGLLSVSLIKIDESLGTVVLPNETLEGYTTIQVPINFLQAV